MRRVVLLVALNELRKNVRFYSEYLITLLYHCTHFIMYRLCRIQTTCIRYCTIVRILSCIDYAEYKSHVYAIVPLYAFHHVSIMQNTNNMYTRLYHFTHFIMYRLCRIQITCIRYCTIVRILSCIDYAEYKSHVYAIVPLYAFHHVSIMQNTNNKYTRLYHFTHFIMYRLCRIQITCIRYCTIVRILSCIDYAEYNNNNNLIFSVHNNLQPQSIEITDNTKDK